METLVYLIIFAILSVTIVNVLVTTMRSFAEARTSRALALSGIVLERAARETRAALSIDTAGSILDSHPGKLKLNSTDDSGNPKTLEFYLESGVVKLKEDSVVSGALTSSYLEITNLVFRSASSSHGAVVKMELSARDQRDRYARVKNFNTSVVLRGGY
ncbi:MAG: hypothetical protein UV08_C0009G0003 [Parcubacteria group bacterium GW2011_GWA2_42_18]|nr:MAG: hypothetical protein UV08_C0009G0003 [Parcubacteria group bacterium GW2011_GWA2_42_18]